MTFLDQVKDADPGTDGLRLGLLAGDGEDEAALAAGFDLFLLGGLHRVAADLLAAGADGIFVDQNNDLEKLIELVGPQGLIVGGLDTGVLTNGNPVQIRALVAQRISLARRLPGFFFCITGETPQNVPVENLEAFWEAVREYGAIAPGGS